MLDYKQIYLRMLYGKIVVIKRSGADGAQFPLTTSNCLFGRSNDCDIRIQLPNVSREHCRVSVADNGEVYLTNLSTVNPITVNSKYIDTTLKLHHGDVFTIIDRSFRFEIPNMTGKSPIRSPLKNSVITPVKGSPNKGMGTPKVSFDINLLETMSLLESLNKGLSPFNTVAFMIGRQL
ncbi:MKI67 [Mytilus edulis]|uniref:MKI67 n=1 Tax=Mytilus edulis TaxID=6550 RepID=A0A8S3PRN3_MYTED|nr:MKI67 [Mytilus edulis]